MVNVLVATDRAPDGPEQIGYGSGRAALRYEELTVSVPPGHQPGRIEWSRSRSHDPAASFVVVQRQRLDEAAFKLRVAEHSKGTGLTGVFVHGYNYSLQEAVFRVVQLGADVKGVTTPILFSWPSDAAVAGYIADRDAVMYARDDLAHVLNVLSTVPTSRKIGVIGHSMGGWLVMETLRQLRLQGQNEVIARLEVALAAPDIDIDVFRRQLDVVGPLEPPLTLFVSTDDRALDVSRRLAGNRPRVGAVDVTDPKLQEAARQVNVRVIDISSVNASDPSKHDRFVYFTAMEGQRLRDGADMLGSLQKTGAYVFNAAGATISSPFTLAGRVISEQ
ncbi:alpha/beta fold hydrolase [Brucella sp. NBRC 12950]|uniref:alpha/beta hydrolase n=1 Tax=Brucella sp. NBRC 12950 TaxID=2994518 RepID=UPI0024A088F7|nr:alpha/beta fold hydrolase [Brucella sp. NBRC 12950]GLU29891.1 hypothetical protein Brsp01_51240 [Brucella sp. NBRC 12950]